MHIWHTHTHFNRVTCSRSVKSEVWIYKSRVRVEIDPTCKKPDPSKMAILRTQTPAIQAPPFHWRVQGFLGCKKPDEFFKIQIWRWHELLYCMNPSWEHKPLEVLGILKSDETSPWPSLQRNTCNAEDRQDVAFLFANRLVTGVMICFYVFLMYK